MAWNTLIEKKYKASNDENLEKGMSAYEAYITTSLKFPDMRCKEIFPRISRKFQAMYAAAKTSFATCLMFCSLACGAAPDHDALMRLHVLPDKERINAFNKRDDDSKLELFFIDSAAHPPLRSLRSTLAMQGACFARRLRIEIEKRYVNAGRAVISEAFGLIGVVREMKHQEKNISIYRDIQHANRRG